MYAYTYGQSLTQSKDFVVDIVHKNEITISMCVIMNNIVFPDTFSVSIKAFGNNLSLYIPP
jgi:hypothetical protein